MAKGRNTRHMVMLLGALSASGALAQTFTSLYIFPGPAGGGGPKTRLVQGFDGNLYGTTSGAYDDPGTFFSMTPSGALTTRYAFCNPGPCVGAYPNDVTLSPDGYFYGTTAFSTYDGYGAVFKVLPNGLATSLYNFCPSYDGCTNGLDPAAGVVVGSDGNIYGTTTGAVVGANNSGSIFRLTPDGAYTTLYYFCTQSGCPDGRDPAVLLVEGVDGAFYGTTNGGGVNGDYGTVFKITKDGVFTSLHSFCSQAGCVDGETPAAALIWATDGDLYGATSGGGIHGNYGTIYKITPGGVLTTLYSFCSSKGCPDGQNPVAPLVEASDKAFYGTAMYGGGHRQCNDHGKTAGCGSIFKISASGLLTVLHDFCAQSECTDGANPAGGLVQATSGAFYGSTLSGGAYCGGNQDCGTLFSFSVGLGPFVKTLPHEGRHGAKIHVLGSTLTGATEVSFNGVPASFSVVSDTEIIAIVPSGCTTGPLAVLTPGGALFSGPFLVRQ